MEQTEINRQFMKEIKIDGLKLIGTGKTALVYEYGNNQVLKVFHEGCPFEKIRKEKERSERLFEAGLPCPRVYDMVKAGNSLGLIIERFYVETMTDQLLFAMKSKDREKVRELIREYVSYAKEAHSYQIPAGLVPDFKEEHLSMAEKLKDTFFTKEEYLLIRKLLLSIPDCRGFIHGDLNFTNVMSGKKDYLFFDLELSGSGDPIFEWPSLYLLTLAFKFHPEIGQEYGITADGLSDLINQIIHVYYEDLSQEEITKKMALIRILGFLELISAKRPEDLSSMPLTEKNYYKSMLKKAFP